MTDRERYLNLEGWMSFALLMGGSGMSVKKFITPFVAMGEKKLSESKTTSDQETWQTFLDALKDIEKS